MYEPLLLTPEEAGERLRVGRTEIFRMLRRGDLESVLIGERRRRIPVDALETYIRRLREAQAVVVA
jgi:excisionase family DNA binding protein